MTWLNLKHNWRSYILKCPLEGNNQISYFRIYANSGSNSFSVSIFFIPISQRNLNYCE